MSAPAHGDGHRWEYEGYDPGQERLREALCTLGNGYFATRGAAPEAVAGPAHYPGTYRAGCYNRLTSRVAGHTVENEDMVNLPNWLPLRFRVREPGDGAAGPWLSPDDAEVLAYRQSLDLAGGTLTRRMRLRDGAGRVLGVRQQRLVHLVDPHLAALRTEFTAENWAGTLEVESALDGDVRNEGVERYRALRGGHLTGWRTGETPRGVLWLECRTRSSGVRVALAARTRSSAPDPEPVRARTAERAVAQTLNVPLAEGRTVAVDKVVALHTSLDAAVSDLVYACDCRVCDAPQFERLRATHRAAWARLWRRAELTAPGEPGRLLRLHLFHVLQTLSPHTAELDVGVPARGLHGEAYRGHVFWDELFVLPYLNLHLPEVSRALLLYRYRRLPRAVQSAVAAGRRGALYPWQSGSDGREETQRLHLNPRSGRWLPDHSHLQHHVGSAVAYNVWHYGRTTGDLGFLHGPGAEMLLQIARLWGDAAVWDGALGRYRIRGVLGPDEYHDAYPGAARPGIDDNAYTNVTAAWVLDRALELLRELPEPRRGELAEHLALDGEETRRWEEVSRKLYVPWHRGVISQFEGYGDLAELDWAAYRERYGEFRRLDRVLEAEGDSVNRYQASKQADVLMLGYLFPPDRLAALFRRLGYRMDDELWRATVDYYLRRTSHGSTLSSVVHAWVLARARRPDSWAFCREALLGDAADLQGGTTPEGIHLGAMAGTLDLVQRGLTGLEADGDGEGLRLDPAPLPQLSPFDVSVRYRGHWGVRLRLQGRRLEVAVPASAEAPLPLTVAGRAYAVAPGSSLVVDLPAA
ncbi:glycoside hydrolase family 65 protein [Streptomyces sp. WMMC897]|uniref:glycoside hydrolase family 65 protein n=1 Tax=Streptomyces sp. WMMC897 TaxID=3014782 RepID=UPI0022B6BF2C|nr:glycosyl hydrolase family 65 protein [Streptomyces sp. WMMC897]MCZ7417744.1 glycoside hydrolase family 65 protein [Streptomyces sp. WMMC897]